MWSNSTFPVLTVLLASGMVPLSMYTAAFEQPANGYFALVGGTVYVSPTDAPIRDGIVLIQGGKMADAGMSFRQILASLTTAPAERFGESKQLGRIAAALEADLVVLKEDPSKNIRALTSVRYTIRGGEIIYRARE